MKCVCIGGPLDGRECEVTSQYLRVPTIAKVRNAEGQLRPTLTEVRYERLGDVLLVIDDGRPNAG
jgi:hypothetical protein